jgi:hypothetical protein
MDRFALARLTELTTAVVLALTGLGWIWNSNAWSGPVVWRLSAAHGVHSNDWLSLVAWAAALMLVVRPRRVHLVAVSSRRTRL